MLLSPGTTAVVRDGGTRRADGVLRGTSAPPASRANDAGANRCSGQEAEVDSMALSALGKAADDVWGRFRAELCGFRAACVDVHSGKL